MQNLTEAERAYRRGALQSIIFLQRKLISEGLCSTQEGKEIFDYIAAFHLEIVRGRDSLSNEYLGTFMDQILQDVIRLKDHR